MVLWYSRQLSGEPSCVPAQDEIARVAVRTLLNTRIFLCVGIARIVCLTAVSVKFYRKHLNRFSTIDKIRRIIVAKQPIAEKALYEQEEQQIQEKSDAFIRILTQRGILGNDQIKDERIRQAQQEKQRRMYHNTRLLLEQYRNIAWALECFPRYDCCGTGSPAGGSGLSARQDGSGNGSWEPQTGESSGKRKKVPFVAGSGQRGSDCSETKA